MPNSDEIVNLVFQDLDYDSNGNLSKSEAAKDIKIQGDFPKIDSNKDNSITKQELTAFIDKLAKNHNHP